MMKKILLSPLVVMLITLKAQVFINTSPSSVKDAAVEEATEKVQEGVKVTKEVVTETEKEVIESSTIEVVDINKRGKVVGEEIINTVTKETPVVTRTTTTTTTTSAAPNYNTNNYASAGADVPPNAEPGKCYARCLMEDRYTFQTERVVDQPRMVRSIKLPALYKTVYDTVVISAGSTRQIPVPAEYETINEQVMVTPSTTKWVKGKADAGCLSANPQDCQVMCLVEVPAVYKTVTKRVLKNEAYTRTESIPMQYKIKTRQVIVQPERVVEEETPATYKTIQKRVLASKGGYEVWREILCGDDLTSAKIASIQRALQSKGYNPGPIDNIFGSRTKNALIQYQKDKGLPVGNLNLETLRALGVQ